MTMIELKNISKCFTTANGERIQAIKDEIGRASCRERV